MVVMEASNFVIKALFFSLDWRSCSYTGKREGDKENKKGRGVRQGEGHINVQLDD